jgi:hypothetical protein
MYGVCLTCGLSGELEAHHVAGRRNHAATVGVCVECHRILGIWQRAAGIELRETVEGTEFDATRALLVGALHLVRLFAEQHSDGNWFPNWLIVHTGRAVSKLLDLMEPADRPGRWLPDATVPPIEGSTVERRAISEAEQIAEIAHLGGALSTIVGEIPEFPTATWTVIAEDPGWWMDAVDHAVMEDLAYATALSGLVAQYMDLSGGMIMRLLQVDDLDQADEVLLEELAAWFDCMRQLLDEVQRITGTEIAVAS